VAHALLSPSRVNGELFDVENFAVINDGAGLAQLAF